MAPRVSTRGTSSSDSDPPKRTPKLADRRSPQSEPLSQKKLGTRIAGLETQLQQAQGELKILKNQLASAETAKKQAQNELHKKTNKPTVSVSVPVQGTRCSPSENPDSNNEKETDVFEVPIETVNQTCEQDDVKVNVESPEKVKPGFEEAIAAKNEEIGLLKVTIEEKEKKLEAFGEENEVLKRQLSEATVRLSTAVVNEEKVSLKLTKIDQEFEKSKKDGIELKGRLKEVEGAKEALETEMKRLRVQTEQWRKAADAAAAILAGGGGEGRCGSMDKHYGGVFEGFEGLGDESDDGKRKGSGMRMFGDLWKKKGNK